MTFENIKTKRIDFMLRNSRKLKLNGSVWKIINRPSKICLIYLHSNSGNRTDVVKLLKYLVPLNINVASFDFAGCG